MSFSDAFLETLTIPGTHIEYQVSIGLVRRSFQGRETATFRAATKPYVTPDGVTAYTFPFSGQAEIRASLQSVLSDRGLADAFPAYGSLIFPNDQQALDALFGYGGFHTSGQPVTLHALSIPPQRLGPQRALLFAGIAGPHRLTDETLTVPLLEETGQLDREIATETITREVYDAAPEASLGRTVPIVLGTVDQMPITPIHRGELTYLVAGHLCQSVTPFVNGLEAAVSSTSVNSAGHQLVTLAVNPGSGLVTASVEGKTLPHINIFSNQFAEVGVEVFRLGGVPITSLSSSALDAMRAAYPYAVSLPILERTTARDVLATLSRGVPTYQTSSDMLIEWGPFTGDLTGTPELSFANDLEIVTAELEEVDPFRGVTIQYAPQEIVFTPGSIAGAITDPETLTRLTSQFFTVQAEQRDVEEHWPFPSFQTRLRLKTDAEALAVTHLARFGEGYELLRLRARHRLFTTSGLHALIAVSRPRMGLRGMQNWRVMEINRTFHPTQTEVSLVLRGRSLRTYGSAE